MIYPILASLKLNNDIAVSFRTSLQKKLWNFLISESEAEEYLIKNNKEFVKDMEDPYLRAEWLSPFLNTDFLISESVNLELNLVNGIIRLTEVSGALKDRYSMISYVNWFVSFLDKNLIREDNGISDLDAILAVSRIM